MEFGAEAARGKLIPAAQGEEAGGDAAAVAGAGDDGSGEGEVRGRGAAVDHVVDVVSVCVKVLSWYVVGPCRLVCRCLMASVML